MDTLQKIVPFIYYGSFAVLGFLLARFGIGPAEALPIIFAAAISGVAGRLYPIRFG